MTAYVAAGEVPSLEHELRNHTMELRALVSETFLAGTESTEVLHGPRDDIVVECEVDPTRLICSMLVSPSPLEESRHEIGATEMRKVNRPLVKGSNLLLTSLVALLLASRTGPSQETSK